MLDALTNRLDRLRLHLRAFRRAVDDARKQTDQALQTLGLNAQTAAPVIDVGATPSHPIAAIAKRAAQAVLVVVAAALVGLALLSLGIFTGTALLAYLILTQCLGVRVDLSPAAT